MNLEAHEIIDRTMEEGDARKLTELTGKSEEWWNSHRRRPKTEDYHRGTGNKSPVTFYLQYIRQRFAANPRSAKRTHRLVNSEVEATFEAAVEVVAFCTRAQANELLKQMTEAVVELNKKEVDSMTKDDLARLDKELNEAAEAIEETRRHVRVVRRMREMEGRASAPRPLASVNGGKGR